MRRDSLFKSYEKCDLCPRRCGVNRRRSRETARAGFCGESDQLRVGYVGPHFGEEPPISGDMGSGTVFLAGCSLRCAFCQNYQISHQGLGSPVALEELLLRLATLISLGHVHNINFVTPDQFFPHVFRLVSRLREEGFDIPIVFNLSGYESLESIHMAKDYADIYLPDYKYANPSLAWDLSKCRDYPKVALDAISEMVRQKGFLDACTKGGAAMAKRGVLVRHLILPGKLENSVNALTTLFLEFGKALPLSLMSQYHPTRHQYDKDLNRFLTRDEFDRVYAHAMELGFENLFVQFPEIGSNRQSSHFPSPFLPDFQQAEPFQ